MTKEQYNDYISLLDHLQLDGKIDKDTWHRLAEFVSNCEGYPTGEEYTDDEEGR